VRGHLRFWWRATRGAEYNSWQALREREGQIWGDTDRQSPVRIRVDCPTAVHPKRGSLRRYEKDLYRRYALFPPFEDKRRDLDSDRLLEGGGFHLKVSISGSDADLRDDIDAALWGWLNFGGMGARTRRGVGALYCEQYAGWDAGRIRGDGGQREWPVLKGGTLLVGSEPLSWPNCWLQLLRFYRDFRQDRGLNGRGKTSWPEPEQIRAIHRGEQPGPEGFPRGALGLPIVFHFKDSWKDPPDRTLNVKDPHGRMASPVILRPFAISKDQALPLILALNTGARPLYLHGGEGAVEVQTGHRKAIEELISSAEDRWQVKAVRI
jgi:CRISPR-associated protein Cmr1